MNKGLDRYTMGTKELPNAIYSLHIGPVRAPSVIRVCNLNNHDIATVRLISAANRGRHGFSRGRVFTCKDGRGFFRLVLAHHGLSWNILYMRRSLRANSSAVEVKKEHVEAFACDLFIFCSSFFICSLVFICCS